MRMPFRTVHNTDVAFALHTLTKAWCSFAVKCGGHSRNPDFSNSVGGVTINLRRMNSVKQRTNGSVAIIGGGAVLADVYTALDPHNISSVGGRVGTVVLADATFVTVNEYQHPDLYWALRGAGGGNFGVITSFLVRTFPQDPLYSGRRSWNDTYTPQVADAVFDMYTTNDTNAQVDFYYGYVQASDSFSVADSLRYLEAIQNPSSLCVHRSDTRRDVGWIGQHLFQTTTTYPSRQWFQQSLQIFCEEISCFRNVSDFNPQIISYTIPARAIRGMSDRGGNALGLADMEGPLLITFLSAGWVRAEDDALVGSFFDRVFARLEDKSRQLNVYHPYKYISHGRLGEDIFSSYGVENRERLVQVQESVDPKGIFTSSGLGRDGFKLRWMRICVNIFEAVQIARDS
ncbi:FAD-binding domain-containing protein [Setomelanomma holmii]|uniref:FAD-binding domain-containing protein n=1 Tax=Setomelanomma holmii TaxID=210430 RepID=A0A9P4LFI6_9PLEO|nr:FAD-binding domain-containing protein [Setomelanomma holmii]